MSVAAQCTHCNHTNKVLGSHSNGVPAFSRDAKVKTKVDLAAAGREDVEGQHSKVAPIGMQNKATFSSKL